jgi:hypothetical protein
VVYANAVNTYAQLVVCLLFFQTPAPPRARREFHWDWHQVQSLSSATALKDAKIAASKRAALANAIETQIGLPNPHDPELASEDQVRQAVLNANIKVIGLNQDEKEPLEVVAQVQHFCSPTGNCSLWFFRWTPDGYRLLLAADGEGFIIQKTAASGFRDLVVNMHSSATDQWLEVYRYARGLYWRVACYDADWAPVENGVGHQLKEPRITPSPCK